MNDTKNRSPVTKTVWRTLGRLLNQAAAKVHDPYTDQLNRMAAELREEIIRQGDRVLDRVVEFEIRSRRDIVYAGDQDAALESNVFARESFRHTSYVSAHADGVIVGLGVEGYVLALSWLSARPEGDEER